jgi:hypothetical protein
MSESPRATAPHPRRSVSVKQPEWAASLTERQRRAGADRRPRERSLREQARQHAVVATWLRDLVRKG